MKKRYLDIGPGNSPTFMSGDAIDIEDSRKYWKETAGVNPNRFTFVFGRAENLPYDSNTFDDIFAGGVFGAYAKLEPSVHEACRVLKPGGHIMIRTWGKYKKQSLQLLKRCGLRITNVERQGMELRADDDEYIIEGTK